MVSFVRRGLETLVRPLPAADVTSIGSEADPAEGGVDRAAVDAIWKAAIGAYETGLYPAMALCLRRKHVTILIARSGTWRGTRPTTRATRSSGRRGPTRSTACSRRRRW
jgi:hypothetical protein